MSKWVHGDDLAWVAPLRKGTNRHCRLSVRVIWLVINVELLAGDSQAMVERVGAAMGSNGYVIQVSSTAVLRIVNLYHSSFQPFPEHGTQRLDPFAVDRSGPISRGADQCRLGPDR